MNPKLEADIRAARRAAVPLLAIKTPDPGATTEELTRVFNGDTPLIRWNCVDGLQPVNQFGAMALVAMTLGQLDDNGNYQATQSTQHPNVMLTTLLGAPGRDWEITVPLKNEDGSPVTEDGTPMAEEVQLRGTVIIMYQAHRWIADPMPAQAIWNLRDYFKEDGRMLVMLGPSFTWPSEIAADVVELDEPYPDEDQLRLMTERLLDGNSIESTPEEIKRTAGAMIGLPSFSAETAISMSIRNRQVNHDSLVERRIAEIEQTKGITVYQGSETFFDLRGCANAVSYLRRVAEGDNPPRCLVLVDEMDKQVAGIAGDLSGTSQDQIGAQLQWMTEHRAQGMLLLGPAGAGKTHTAKCMAGEYGLMLLMVDLGASKAAGGGLVGGSEQQIRAILKTIEAVGGDRTFWFGTMNRGDVLTPELRRRFDDGMVFFDLPSDDERKALWRHYLAKYQIGKQPMPQDAGWTGAEIERCCRKSAQLKFSLVEAAAYIVPVSKSAATEIEKLRQEANGTYIAASYPGAYVYEATARPPSIAARPGGRRIETD